MQDMHQRPGLSKRHLWVGIVLLLATIGIPFGFGYLPFTLYLKNALHFSATQVSAFVGAGNIPWYFKPFAALMSDHASQSRGRKRGMITGWFLSGVAWIVLGFTYKSYPWLFAIAIAINALLTISAAGLVGVMGEIGKREDATGRLSSLRSIVFSICGLIGGPLGGWLAGEDLRTTCFFGAGFMMLLTAVSLRAKVLDAEEASTETRNLGQLLLTTLKARDLWVATAVLALLSCAPGFGVPLLFYQTDTLKLSPQFLGNLGIAATPIGIFAGLLYAWLCRRWTLRQTIVFSVLLHAVGVLGYLFMGSELSTILVTCEYCFISALGAIPFVDLSLRASPKGLEAVGMALMTAVLELMVTLSAILGSWLYDHYGLSLQTLVVTNSVTSLIGLAAVPLISKGVLDRKEGSAPAETDLIQAEA